MPPAIKEDQYFRPFSRYRLVHTHFVPSLEIRPRQKPFPLASLGVEVVAGDFDNPSSLDAAFKGASAIYSVPDFWQGFASPLQRENASASGESIGICSREHEVQRNRNIIDAASKVTTHKRFVFSSLANTNQLSGGKYTHVYHFDSKAIG